jgi:hypothetical protein
VLTMSVVDLIGWLKEVEEAFEKASTSLQQDGKLYLTEEEWDTWRKKLEAENHFGSDTRGGGTGKGRGCGRDHGCGGSSSSGPSSKPTDNECRRCGKMGHWAHECHSKPKKEQARVTQDEEEASLMLASATLIRLEVISSNAEVEIHEEKVFTHLDEEKECDTGTWVLDTGVTNHMSGCRAMFMKINTVVLGTVRFGDDSVVWIKGCRTVVFMCKNGESQSFDGVYFIPRLTTNIVRVDQLDEIGYKIDIDTGNCLYLLHQKFT